MWSGARLCHVILSVVWSCGVPVGKYIVTNTAVLVWYRIGRFPNYPLRRI